MALQLYSERRFLQTTTSEGRSMDRTYIFSSQKLFIRWKARTRRQRLKVFVTQMDLQGALKD